MEYFSSVRADKALVQGRRYYIELVVKSKQQGCLVKVGLTTAADMQVPYGFSDKETGWAYYTSDRGYSRHNSCIHGSDYGRGYHANQTLGVYVDLVQGCLSFSVDGDYYGPCFSDLNTDLPFYLAVASYDEHQSFELLRKTPVCWEPRVPALFVKKYVQRPCIFDQLNAGLFREVVKLI